MPQRTSDLKPWHRTAVRLNRALAPTMRKIRIGISYIWNRPLIISGVLLVLTILLFSIIMMRTFSSYTNCNYLFRQKASALSFICNGIKVEQKFEFDAPIVGHVNLGTISFPILQPLEAGLNKTLEAIRKFVTWNIIILFALASLFLTILLNFVIQQTQKIVNTVKVLIRNKEERRSFLNLYLNTWLLIFVSLGLVFYFTVGH